jgi:predicted nucleic acid-binding protein
VFVDTSAILAIVDHAQARHDAVARTWNRLLADGARLWVTNYVLCEAFSLIQRRLGVAAVRDFWENMVPAFSIRWVEETSHASGVATVLAARRRDLSLVDCVSFRAMRDLGIQTAFTLDGHFAEEGFDCVPESAPD